MSQFVDVYMPTSIPGYPCLSSPRFSTTITETSGGDEGRNSNWQHPLRRFKLPAAEARAWQTIQDLRDHFLITRGPKFSFPFRDPLDFATVALNAPNEATAFVVSRTSANDQQFATGDGVTRLFQLSKTYVRGGETYTRLISLPVLSTVKIAAAGVVQHSGVSVTRLGGGVTFDVAPANGAALTWGGLFDVPTRFDSDEALDLVVAAYLAGGASEINLDETRFC